MLSILLATHWNMTKKILPSCSVPKVLMKDQFFLVQQTLVPIIFQIFWSEKKKNIVMKQWERKKMHIVEVVALIIMMNVVNNWTEALFYLWNWPLTRQFNQLVSRYVEEHLKFGYVFWEGHKIWKNLPLKIWRYSVARWKKHFFICSH